MAAEKSRLTYKEAGVDIKAGEEAVRRIKKTVASTFTPNVLTGLGHFGALFQFPKAKYQEPVLVSSVDGVGTKLKIAFLLDRHDTVGEDLVNHCVNDILATGAQPLYFLDYIATGKLRPEVIESIIEGMVRGCKLSSCALIGGEIAEMPDFYQPGEYDIAGTIVGIVEKKDILDGSSVTYGDVLIGLKSNGLHTNGYTLVRKILLERKTKVALDSYQEELGCTWAEELLRVHRNYLPIVRPFIGNPALHGISHITGGGILANTRRIIPDQLDLKIQWDAWERPAIFRILQEMGGVQEDDMRDTFNLGIGLILIVAKEAVDDFCDQLRAAGEDCILIGEVQKK